MRNIYKTLARQYAEETIKKEVICFDQPQNAFQKVSTKSSIALNRSNCEKKLIRHVHFRLLFIPSRSKYKNYVMDKLGNIAVKTFESPICPRMFVAEGYLI